MQKVKESSIEQLKRELEEIKSSTQKGNKTQKLKEIAKGFCAVKDYDFVFETFQLVGDQQERNILIGDIIEQFLIPAKEFATAKKFAKFIVNHEMQPLLMVRIALAENNKELALQLANNLDSALTRNFAFIQIIETYLIDNQKNTAKKVCDAVLENTKSIYNAVVRSYILRDIAIDLYLANREKELAKQAADLIPDPTIKEQTLKKIGA